MRISGLRTDDDIVAARQVVRQRLGQGGVAMLTTVSPEGRPHTTWMGTLGATDFGEIVTITSPDSEKVKNIKANPQVEWLFTGPDRRALVYFQGTAEIVESVTEIKHFWNSIGDKEQAFFLRYFNKGIGFAVVKTMVDAAFYCVPTDNHRVELTVSDLNETSVDPGTVAPP